MTPTPRLARLTNTAGRALDFLCEEQPIFLAFKGRAFIAQWDQFPDQKLIYHYREFHRPLHAVFATLDESHLAPPETAAPATPDAAPIPTGEEDHEE